MRVKKKKVAKEKALFVDSLTIFIFILGCKVFKILRILTFY